MTAGYSGTLLAKKLGIKEDSKVAAVGAPTDYETLLEPLPARAQIVENVTSDADVIHLFTNRRDELFRRLAEFRRIMKKDGILWVSWYKKAAKLPTEITEDTIREAALPLGLVDVKVCAIDDKWSGLKLVIRRENRDYD